MCLTPHMDSLLLLALGTNDNTDCSEETVGGRKWLMIDPHFPGAGGRLQLGLGHPATLMPQPLSQEAEGKMLVVILSLQARPWAFPLSGDSLYPQRQEGVKSLTPLVSPLHLAPGREQEGLRPGSACPAQGRQEQTHTRHSSCGAAKSPLCHHGNASCVVWGRAAGLAALGFFLG